MSVPGRTLGIALKYEHAERDSATMLPTMQATMYERVRSMCVLESRKAKGHGRGNAARLVPASNIRSIHNLDI